MPASYHDRTQDQLRQRMPGAAKRIRRPWYTGTDAHGPIRGHGLEYDVKGREGNGVAFELAGFDDGDEEDGEGEPPDVVRELAAELLTHKVAAVFFGGTDVGGCEGAFDPSEDGGGALFIGVFVCVETEGTFFVDIGVAHCDCYYRCQSRAWNVSLVQVLPGNTEIYWNWDPMLVMFNAMGNLRTCPYHHQD